MNRFGPPPVGIEPTTFRLEGGRTIRCAKEAFGIWKFWLYPDSNWGFGIQSPTY